MTTSSKPPNRSLSETAIESDETGEWIYGYDNESTAYEFHTLAVDAAGVRPVDAIRDLISGFYHRVRYGGGRVYATAGIPPHS